MPETNQELPPQIRPHVPPPTPQEQIKKQYDDFIAQAKKNPQLMLLVNNFRNFWSKFGFRIKLVTGIIGISIIVLVGLRFGTTLATVFKPAPAVPSAIPDVTPTPTTKVSTELQKIQDEIKDFPILLPDPAIPPVDPDIHLKTLPIEK